MQLHVLSGRVVVSGVATHLAQQTAAALLALTEARGQVHADTLASMIWDPPGTRRQVVKLMPRLRETVGGGRIIGDEGRYALAAQDDDYVDLWAWRKRVKGAGELAANDDPRAAEVLYQAALAMWPDPPLTGLPATPEMDAVRQRLLDERLDAIASYAQVRLHLGHYREAVADLRPHTDSDTAWHREDLHYAVMTALYRLDRAPEAQQHYDKFRSRLAAEGLEPGLGITRLHDQIRARDERLLHTPPPPSDIDRTVQRFCGVTRQSTVRMGHYVTARRAARPVFATALERGLTELVLLEVPEIDHLQYAGDRGGGRIAHRAVTEYGIEQIIELNAPIPTSYAIHSVARLPRPATRVVYVQRDPGIAAYCDSLIAHERGVGVVVGGLHDPRAIITHPEVNELIDWSEPVLILDQRDANTMSDADDPGASLAVLMDAAAPGSLLALGLLHGQPDQLPDRIGPVLAAAYGGAPADEQLQFRSLDQIRALVPPSLRILEGPVEIGDLWAPEPTPPTGMHQMVIVAIKDKHDE